MHPHLLRCGGGGSARLTVWGSAAGDPPVPSHARLQADFCRFPAAAAAAARRTAMPVTTRRCAAAVARAQEHGQTVSDRVWFCKQRIQVCAGRARCGCAGADNGVYRAPFTERGKRD
jgi:hypothetical protein